ncbi:MAG TPA: hypothetical protein VHX14_20990 [Thermoanaerobaculia bacterium]|jgi:hypothetical protein|nr:hypothetical protein [Thermoanaerobaculia bacterium]
MTLLQFAPDFAEMLHELSANGADFSWCALNDADAGVGAKGLSRDIIWNVARRNVTVRKYKLGEEPEFDEEILAMTPGERLALTWYVTRQAWGFHSGTFAKPEFRRDVARVIRSRR